MVRSISVCAALTLQSLAADASIDLQWAARAGGSPGNDQGSATTVDAAGNVYTTGFFSGKVDFNPGTDTFYLTAAGGTDIFISKLDAAGNFVWARNMGGTADDRGCGITVDGGGNVFVTGYFQQTADFDPGTGRYDLLAAGSGVPDIFILKLHAAGNLAWAKSFGGYILDQGMSIHVQGNSLYVAGNFMGVVDFDPGSATANIGNPTYNIAAFVTRYDTACNLIWARDLKGSSEVTAYAITADASGNVYTTGLFRGTADFNPDATLTYPITSASSSSIFVSKLDASGNFVWAKSAGGTTGDNYGLSLRLDASGNVFTTGFYSNSVDFNPGGSGGILTSQGGMDAFLLKHDGNGNFVWVKGFGSAAYDAGTSVLTDNSGNIYLVGTFNGKADFDPGADSFYLSTANSSMFICKLNPAGNFLWAGKNASGNALAASAAIDAARNIHTAGYFDGTTNFSPGQTAGVLASSMPGDNDIFISKLVQPSCATSASITRTGCDSVVVNGQRYTSSGTFSQTRTNAAGCDSILTIQVVLQKNTGTLTTAACDSFILAGQVYKSSGTYTTTLTNAAGCDSLLTLNLTIRHSTTGTITRSACDTVSLNGQTYTASGTYTQRLTNAAGCDSVVTLNLTIHKSKRDTVTVTSCGPYTRNGQVYTTSGIYVQSHTTGAGCDSTLTLKLTIHDKPDTSVIRTGNVLTAKAPGISYQWIDCGNGYAPVANGSSQSYTATRNGSFALVVSNGNCSDTSACIVIGGMAGISETEGTVVIRAYPNPVRHTLFVETDQQMPFTSIRLMNLAGQVLQMHSQIADRRFGLDMSGCAPGIYLVEIRKAGYTERIKITKE